MRNRRRSQQETNIDAEADALNAINSRRNPPPVPPPPPPPIEGAPPQYSDQRKPPEYSEAMSLLYANRKSALCFLFSLLNIYNLKGQRFAFIRVIYLEVVKVFNFNLEKIIDIVKDLNSVYIVKMECV